MNDDLSETVRFNNWKNWFTGLDSNCSIESNLDGITFERIYGIESFNNMMRDMIIDD